MSVSATTDEDEQVEIKTEAQGQQQQQQQRRQRCSKQVRGKENYYYARHANEASSSSLAEHPASASAGTLHFSDLDAANVAQDELSWNERGQVRAKQPRRRRLANRRQYAKSRRLASSYLRSQFVRYDILSRRYHEMAISGASGSEEQQANRQSSNLELNLIGQQRHKSNQSGACWCRVQSLQGAQQQGSDQHLVHCQSAYSSSSLDSCPAIPSASTATTTLPHLSATWQQLNSSCESARSLTRRDHVLEQSVSELPVQVTRSETTIHLNRSRCCPLKLRQQAATTDSSVAPTCTLNQKEQNSSGNNKSPQGRQQAQRTLINSSSSSSFRQLPLRSPSSDTIPQLSSNLRQPITGNHPPLTNRLLKAHAQSLSITNSPAPSLQTKPLTSQSSSSLTLKKCIDNVHFNDLFHGPVNDSSVTISQSVRTDPRLYKDDVDIKFSRALNSCKLPQIRYASKERLFERLTDLRFLSIDFLNTFLLTYRVFTSAEDVLEALKGVHYHCDRYFQQQQQQQQQQLLLSKDADVNLSSSNLSPPANQTRQKRPIEQANQAQEQQVEVADCDEVDRKQRQHSKVPPTPNRDVQPVAVPCSSVASQTSGRPSVPPRSSNLSFSGEKSTSIASQQATFEQVASDRKANEANQGQFCESRFLLAPSSAPGSGQHQKRRSTISALTPITGSNSSSLANLAASAAVAAASSNSATTGPYFIQRQQQQQHLAGSLSGNNLCEWPNSPASSQFGILSQASSLCSSIGNPELGLELPEEESVRVSSTSVNIRDSQPEQSRLRSSSMSRTATSGEAYLSVPSGRQVRANSFSHLASDSHRPRGAKLSPSYLSGGEQSSFLTGNNNSTCEHWRLSYKRAAQAAARVAPASPVQRHDYLSVGAPNNGPRRASSSDADYRLTFHVTFYAPPTPPEPTDGTCPPLIEGNLLSSATDRPGDISPSICEAPPPSPNPEVIDQEKEAARFSKVSQSNQWKQRQKVVVVPTASTLEPSGNFKRRRRIKARASNSSAALSAEDSASSSEKSPLSPSRSESGLIQSSSSSSNETEEEEEGQEETSEDYEESSSGGQANVLATSNSSSSASSSSSSSSSSSLVVVEKPRSINKYNSPAPTSKQFSQIGMIKLQHHGKLGKKDQKHKTNKRNNENHTSLPGNKDFKSPNSRLLGLKEIEFNEAAGRFLDCDTSADEDKVLTLSESSSNVEEDEEKKEANSSDEYESSKLLVELENKDKFYSSKDTSGKKINLGMKLPGDCSIKANNENKRKKKKKKKKQQVGIDNKSLADAPNEQGDTSSQSEDNQRLLSATPSHLEEEPAHTEPEIKQKKARNSPVQQTQQQQHSKPKEGGLQTARNTPESSSQRSLNSQSQQTLATASGSTSRMATPRSSFQFQLADGATSGLPKAGVIVSSSAPRVSSRRSSTASAASAFAAATAASNNPLLTQPPLTPTSPRQLNFGPGHLNRTLRGDVSGRVGGVAVQPLLTASSEHLLTDQLNPLGSVGCLCQAIQLQGQSPVQAGHTQQRYSISSPQMIGKQSPGYLAGGFQQRQSVLSHHPSCIYFQQQQLASRGNNNPAQSDASSLCNSRASSRLSSCAGLEYSTYSNHSNQVNFHSSSQFMAMNQQQPINSAQAKLLSSSSVNQQAAKNSPLVSGKQVQIGSIQNCSNRSVSGPSNSRTSKRNSTQINVRSVATIRVLSVLRHWVSKHSQDFVNDNKLSFLVQEFLQDLIIDPSLLPAEHKAALQLQQMVQKAANARGTQVDLDLLLAAPAKPSTDSIETLSALEIAEGMTYLDHKIFLAIRSEEFLGQAWMKMDKAIKAPHILLITKRFNDVSRLVSSEIIRVSELHRRVAIIEKWTNVAHICRVVHNFNGVLQICAAFTNSAVFRLKKTWDKIPKTTKTTIDQLQNLVSTDSRFRNMRDAINRCDPPSIPYVGMYLTDLSFIEEGTPNYSPDGLLNFSKMRMIAHVIREIQHLQNGSYKIELNHRVANYLLDASRHLQDDEMYRCSLAIEPKSSVGKTAVQLLNSDQYASNIAVVNNNGQSKQSGQLPNATSTSSSHSNKPN